MEAIDADIAELEALAAGYSQALAELDDLDAQYDALLAELSNDAVPPGVS